MSKVSHADTCALVTGGNQGLGYAIAERLIQDGCRKIVIAGREADKGEKAAAVLAGGGADVSFIAVEMGDVKSVRAMVDTAAERMGSVNAFANAAATTDRDSILDAEPGEFDRIFAVNTRGPFFAIQRIAQHAIKAKAEARIVNILSMMAHCGMSFLASYSASKAALATVTRNAAAVLRHEKIHLHGINLGWMDTPGEDIIQRKWHNAGDDWLEKAEATMPFGQIIKPPHVAGLVSYLLSDDSGVMTGSIIDFDQNIAGAFPEFSADSG